MLCHPLNKFVVLYSCVSIFTTNLRDLRIRRISESDLWWLEETKTQQPKRMLHCGFFYFSFCSCHPVAYLKDKIRNVSVCTFLSHVIPEVLRKGPADSRTPVKRAFFLLGVCCESVRRKSIIHLTAQVTNSVSLVFLFWTAHKDDGEKKNYNRLEWHLDIRPRLLELCCAFADQIFHYSASSAACNRVDHISLQIVLDSQC